MLRTAGGINRKRRRWQKSKYKCPGKSSMANQFCPYPLHIPFTSSESPLLSIIQPQFRMICRVLPKMPFSIVFLLIAAIGLQQLHFVVPQASQNAQPQPSTGGATLPYAGSLYNCGETNTSADNAGQQWNYVFRCKQGDMCVYGTCVNCPPGLQQTYNPYNNMPFLLQCSIVKSVIDRCKVGANGCDQNFDLNRYCGYAFTRTVDGQTYYWNCQNGGNCVEGQCANGGPVVITRCNKAGLYVNSGQCQNGTMGTECNGVQCMNMTYQYTGGQL